MAMAATSVSDADLAFQMQINEALAASIGISSLGRPQNACVTSDARMAHSIQQMELESLQGHEQDRGLAANLFQHFAENANQLLHDHAVACEIDEMPDDEWEDTGDLYERPYGVGVDKEKKFFRVFFKGFPMMEGGASAGAALGGAIMDSSGVQIVQIKKYIEAPTSKVGSQYLAFLEILESAVSLGARNIVAYSDCRTLVNQMKGHWKVTNARRFLYDQALDYIDDFDSFVINLALHGENWPAENMAKLACLSQRQNAASSSNMLFHCIICMEDIRAENIYKIQACAHRFCSSCVKQHVEETVKSGRTFPVPCPQVECAKLFSDDECKALLSDSSLVLYAKKMEEERIPEVYRVYCPYPNCSDLMDRRNFTTHPRQPCGSCKSFLCIDCRVPWHFFGTCSDYQRLPLELKNAEDAKLYRLAENSNWRQCKQCRRMIELLEGCYHMTCRCGHEFCYTCGKSYRDKIPTCSCQLWDEHNIIREEEVVEEEDDFEDRREVFEADRLYKTRLCRFFANGHCRNGVNCRFAHGVHELR